MYHLNLNPSSPHAPRPSTCLVCNIVTPLTLQCMCICIPTMHCQVVFPDLCNMKPVATRLYCAVLCCSVLCGRASLLLFGWREGLVCFSPFRFFFVGAGGMGEAESTGVPGLDSTRRDWTRPGSHVEEWRGKGSGTCKLDELLLGIFSLFVYGWKLGSLQWWVTNINRHLVKWVGIRIIHD